MANSTNYKAVIQVNITETSYPDQNGGITQLGDVYIDLFDSVTGQPIAGNGITVNYIYVDQTGYAGTGSAQILGTNTSVLIYSGVIANSSYSPQGTVIYSDFITFAISQIDVSTIGAGGSGFCDLVISGVETTSETAYNAKDGTATVTALTSHPSIQYKLGSGNFQSSNLFTGLSSGTYTVTTQDANGCTATYTFYVAEAQSILISDPSYTLPNGNISRWNAVFNPILFTYQRKDFIIGSIASGPNGGSIIITPSTSFSNPLPKNGETIYLNAGPYNGRYVVASNTSNTITINTRFIGDGPGGFMNINSERQYYKILTQITYIDPDTGLTNYQTMSSTPNFSGLATADVSSLLKGILRAKDQFGYNISNYSDPNLSVSYQVSYSEQWKNNPGTFIPLANPFYATYSAFQIQEQGSNSLWPYVTFPSSGSTLAGWLSDFTNPVLNNGLPFDVSFIYSEQMAGFQISSLIGYLDVNMQPISTPSASYLLNENSSFLLNENSSKLLISGNLLTGPGGLTQHIGLNRLNLTGAYPANAFYLSVQLFYTNSAGTRIFITNPLIVSISKQCQDYFYYLKWIGKHGAWNYYLFNYNQNQNLKVQNLQLRENRITDYLNADGVQDVISKVANLSVTVHANDIPNNDADGIRSIYSSPKVMAYINGGWQTVILDIASFILRDTRDALSNVKFTFEMSTENVQTQ